MVSLLRVIDPGTDLPTYLPVFPSTDKLYQRNRGGGRIHPPPLVLTAPGRVKGIAALQDMI